MTPLFEVVDLNVTFATRRAGKRTSIDALDGVSLTWESGEILGVVGGSGSGKSTLARSLVGLQCPSSGVVRFEGEPLGRTALARLRRRVQMIFQDPYDSLDPLRTVGELVEEPLDIQGIDRRNPTRTIRTAVGALDAVGLAPERFWGRYPAELSGGERQRVALASALVLEPHGLVCDEPVSALDVSISVQILRLLMSLQRERGMSILFISHDIGTTWSLSDRIVVMHQGRIVESGPSDQVIRAPEHPYTRSLIAAVPNIA